MSKIASWSYTSRATVKPMIGIDHFSGGLDYGESYAIDCTWISKHELLRDEKGEEFVSSSLIFTEDQRPKPHDMIRINDGFSDFQEIRSREGFDMSFFAEATDFKLGL